MKSFIVVSLILICFGQLSYAQTERPLSKINALILNAKMQNVGAIVLNEELIGPSVNKLEQGVARYRLDLNRKHNQLKGHSQDFDRALDTYEFFFSEFYKILDKYNKNKTLVLSEFHRFGLLATSIVSFSDLYDIEAEDFNLVETSHDFDERYEWGRFFITNSGILINFDKFQNEIKNAKESLDFDGYSIDLSQRQGLKEYGFDSQLIAYAAVIPSADEIDFLEFFFDAALLAVPAEVKFKNGIDYDQRIGLVPTKASYWPSQAANKKGINEVFSYGLGTKSTEFFMHDIAHGSPRLKLIVTNLRERLNPEDHRRPHELGHPSLFEKTLKFLEIDTYRKFSIDYEKWAKALWSKIESKIKHSPLALETAKRILFDVSHEDYSLFIRHPHELASLIGSDLKQSYLRRLKSAAGLGQGFALTPNDAENDKQILLGIEAVAKSLAHAEKIPHLNYYYSDMTYARTDSTCAKLLARP